MMPGDAAGARHRAIACFHGLLELLRSPLAHLLVGSGASTRSQVAERLHTPAIDTSLHELRAVWSRSTHGMDSSAALKDVQLVGEVLQQIRGAGDVEDGAIVSAVGAARRLLVAVGASEDAVAQAQALCSALGVKTDGSWVGDVLSGTCAIDTKNDANKHVISVVADALDAATEDQHPHAVQLLRSELYLTIERRDLAQREAVHVLESTSLTRGDAIRLAKLFVALEQWEDAARVCARGLAIAAEDQELQELNQLVLESVTGSMSVAEDRDDSTEGLKIPLATHIRQANGDYSRSDGCDVVPDSQTTSSVCVDLCGDVAIDQEGQTPSRSELLDERMRTTHSDMPAGADIATKPKETRKHLVKRAHTCGSSGEQKAIEEAIDLLTQALSLAASKKQRCKILVQRAEYYLQIGKMRLAEEDVTAASGVPKLKPVITARLELVRKIIASEQSQGTFGLINDQVSFDCDHSRASAETTSGSSDVARSYGRVSIEQASYSGCFHALLTVLQPPLAAYVAERRTQCSRLVGKEELQHKNLSKAGVKMQLQFVKDHWATHFSSALPSSALQDVKTVIQVQGHTFFSATAKRAVFDRGIKAIERLFLVLSIGEEAKRCVEQLKRAMLSDIEDRLGVIREGPTSQTANIESESTVHLEDISGQAIGTELAELSVPANKQIESIEHVSAPILKTDQAPSVDASLQMEDSVMPGVGKFIHNSDLPELHLKDFVVESESVNDTLKADAAVKELADPQNGEIDRVGDQDVEVTSNRPSSGGKLVYTIEHLRNLRCTDHSCPEIEIGSILVTPVQRGERWKQKTAENGARSDKEESPSLCADRPPTRSVLSSLTDNEGTHLIDSPSSLAELPVDTILPEEESPELRIAKLRIAKRDFGNAIAFINQEIKRNKSDQTGHAALFALRARCRLELKQYPTMLADAECAIALDASYIDGHYWASVALFRLGRLDEALVKCNEGLRLDENHESLRLHYKVLTEGSSQSVTAQTCCTEAIKLFDVGEYSQAATLCSRAIELYASEETQVPVASSAYVRRGECYFALGDLTKALDDAVMGLKLKQRKYAKASSLRIRVLSAMGRLHEALYACVIAIAASTELPELVKLRDDLVDQVIRTVTIAGSTAKRKELVQQALAQRIEHKQTEAVVTFTEALLYAGSQKQAATIYLHRAKCYMDLQQYDMAAQDASVASTVPDMRDTASVVLCNALLASERADEALYVCSWVLRESSYAPLLQIQDRIRKSRGDQPLGKSVLQTVASSDTEQLEPWELEVKVLIRQGLASPSSYRADGETLFKKALDFLDRVEDEKNREAVCVKRVAILGHLARRALTINAFDAALEYSRRGLTLKPDWLDGNRLACRACMGLGRWSEALHACELVVAQAPQDTNFQMLRQELDSKKPQAVTTKQTNVIDAPTGAKPSSLSDNNEHRDWRAKVQGLMHTGLSYAEEKNYAAAEKRYTNALGILTKLDTQRDTQVDKFRIKILGHRARCRLASEKYKLASVDAREGINFQPEWIDGYRLLCRAYMGEGKWQQALNSCNHVLSRVPKDVAFVQIKDTLLTKCPGDQRDEQATPPSLKLGASASDDFRSLSKNAMNNVRIQDYATAAAYCTRAITVLTTANPHDISHQEKALVYVNRARCHAANRAFELMLEDARSGRSWNEMWGEAYILECEALLGLGRLEEAETTYAKLSATIPSHPACKTVHSKIDQKRKEERQTELAFTPQNSVGEHHAAKMPSSSSVTVKTPIETLSPSRVAERYPRQFFFALAGSLTAQHYLAAQRFVSIAQQNLADGDLRRAIECLREGIAHWPHLQVPATMLNDYLLIGPHDAVAWGGSTLFTLMQAKSMRFHSHTAEQESWTNCVERYPEEAELHARLADVLYRAGDLPRSLIHIDTALLLKKSPSTAEDDQMRSSWMYLRARCLPCKESSTTGWISSFFTKQPPQTREDEYLTYVQSACFDDIWVPHACYSLGMFYLTKEEFTRAKQFHFLAGRAESRREQLGVFPTIDSDSFADKKMLKDAFSSRLMMLSIRDQQLAILKTEQNSVFWRCGWCATVSPNVQAFVEHKLHGCDSRPTCSAPWSD